MLTDEVHTRDQTQANETPPPAQQWILQCYVDDFPDDDFPATLTVGVRPLDLS